MLKAAPLPDRYQLNHPLCYGGSLRGGLEGLDRHPLTGLDLVLARHDVKRQRVHVAHEEQVRPPERVRVIVLLPERQNSHKLCRIHNHGRCYALCMVVPCEMICILYGFPCEMGFSHHESKCIFSHTLHFKAL